MVGHCGGVQHLLQKRETRKIPYVNYPNHQLHLIVVHAMSVEQAINDFLHVCGSLFNLFRKPTVSLHNNRENLKRLLEQRWTSYLATVTAVLNSFQLITSLIQEIGTSRAHKAQTPTEASGLIREVQEQSFLFIAKMLCKNTTTHFNVMIRVMACNIKYIKYFGL